MGSILKSHQVIGKETGPDIQLKGSVVNLHKIPPAFWKMFQKFPKENLLKRTQTRYFTFRPNQSNMTQMNATDEVINRTIGHAT